jgi:hypothetical protein
LFHLRNSTMASIVGPSACLHADVELNDQQ